MRSGANRGDGGGMGRAPNRFAQRRVSGEPINRRRQGGRVPDGRDERVAARLDRARLRPRSPW